MEARQQINDEMTVLLRQLVMQNQVLLAAHVLKTYFLRLWKIDEVLANEYVRRYFKKYYPEQLERHMRRLKRTN